MKKKIPSAKENLKEKTELLLITDKEGHYQFRKESTYFRLDKQTYQGHQSTHKNIEKII